MTIATIQQSDVVYETQNVSAEGQYTWTVPSDEIWKIHFGTTSDVFDWRINGSEIETSTASGGYVILPPNTDFTTINTVDYSSYTTLITGEIINPNEISNEVLLETNVPSSVPSGQIWAVTYATNGRLRIEEGNGVDFQREYTDSQGVGGNMDSNAIIIPEGTPLDSTNTGVINGWRIDTNQ